VAATASRQAATAPSTVDLLPLARLKGMIADLLADPAHEPLTGAWLQVVLTDPDRPYEAMARLRQRFPHTLDIKFEPV
jgi:exonuclease SbcD